MKIDEYFETIAMIDYWLFVITKIHEESKNEKPRSLISSIIDKVSNHNPTKEKIKIIVHATKERIRLKEKINIDCSDDKFLLKQMNGL